MKEFKLSIRPRKKLTQSSPQFKKFRRKLKNLNQLKIDKAEMKAFIVFGNEMVFTSSKRSKHTMAKQLARVITTIAREKDVRKKLKVPLLKTRKKYTQTLSKKGIKLPLIKSRVLYATRY